MSWLLTSSQSVTGSVVWLSVAKFSVSTFTDGDCEYIAQSTALTVLGRNTSFKIHICENLLG